MNTALDRHQDVVRVVPTERATNAALLDQAGSLRDRAGSLRDQARGLSDILAATYRRRAAELELEAWIAEVQSGIPYDEVHPAA